MDSRTEGSPSFSPDPGVPALAALQRSWIFAGAPEEALIELAALCEARWVEASAYLFLEGAPPDNVYVIADGALEIVRSAPGGHRELVMNVLESGTVGELALLRGESRSASVRAKRRSLIYAIEGKRFLAFVRRWPETAVATARSIADGMVRSENRARTGARRLLWGVIRDPRTPVDFGLELALAAIAHVPGMSEGSRIVVLSSDLPAGVRTEGTIRIDCRALPADATAGQVAQAAQAALTEAQLVIAVTQPGRLDDLARRLSGLVLGTGMEGPRLPTGARSVELISRGAPSAKRVRIGPSWAAVARRVARLLAGRSVGLALGGGAGRAIAHLGVLQVLEELKVEIDFLAGTSMGSVVGALYLANGVEQACAAFLQNSRPRDWLKMIELRSLYSGVIVGKKLGKFIDGFLSIHEIESLAIPYAAISLDLDSGEEFVAREGSLVDSVLASVSVPGIFAPHRYRPPGSPSVRRLVDGGVTNNVPIDTLRAMGADRVIGSHVIKRRDPTRAIVDAGASGWLYRRLAQLPTIARAIVVLKSQLLGIDRTGERSVLTADLPILVDTSDFGFAELWRAAELIQAGRRAAQASAAELRLLGTEAPLAAPAPRLVPAAAAR